MPSAIVVGAGVFGASLAHRLALRGWEVTLVDRHSPGHVLAASGGESRILRFSHGEERWYARSALRARELWRELEAATKAELFIPVGVVWLVRGGGELEERSSWVLQEEGLPVERLAPAAAAELFPSLEQRDLRYALLEPEAGILRAREAVRCLVREAEKHGARLLAGTAEPVGAAVRVGRDSLRADRVVWACGAWLPHLFPGLVDIRVTKQDVFFFGGTSEWQTPPVPVWVDTAAGIYGVGDLDGRGVKAADDREGPPLDPERDPRLADPKGEQTVRAYLETRFPSLRGSPLVGTRTCAYALTPDSNFIVAPHPDHDGVWILGGGSGHGFKHGPALGEYVADLLEEREARDARFGLEPRPSGPSLRAATD